MMPRVLRLGLAAAASLVLVSTGHATTVGGGGAAASDCLAVFEADVNTPTQRPRHIRCADGAACDADGTVNGSCEFAVGICINSAFDPRCTLTGVKSVTVAHALDNGDRRFDPEFQALQTRIDSGFDLPDSGPDCTVPTNFHVPVQGPFGNGVCRQSRKVIKVETLSTPNGGVVYRDRDRIKLTCDPAPSGCTPCVFFPDGTFERIQRQVFNQSCAVSGCHDSQSQQANLLLEDTAAYANLVGVTPTNGSASAAGWKRVMPGDSSQSFLYGKVAGDLPDPNYGARMPFGEGPLDPELVEIIRLWIEGGALETGWVPGTGCDTP